MATDTASVAAESRRRGLTEANLVEDFAAAAPGLGQTLARACYAALDPAPAEAGETPGAHAEAYGEALGLSGPIEPARARFALQTAYALVVKLVAARVLWELHPSTLPAGFDALAAESPEALRGWMSRLEDGELARLAGLSNLFAGEAFSWYCREARWTLELAAAVRGVIRRLGEYDGRAPLMRPAAPGDLFRLLYQRTIPAAVRHAMGEYYTPRWLAEAVLADLPAPPGWRGLDPCCGSGAFLVAMIAEVLDGCAHLAPEARLAEVLGRVSGLDLNPLAVLTARVNYFLAVAGLVEAAAGPVALPVYGGDAVASPPALGLFERVAGNPPWVAWKDLPAGYRDRVQALGRSRGLFSDDGYAGGTDLNLCALVAHTTLERYVAPGGHLGFLMPRQMLQVRSAQGFRRWRLPDGTPLGLQSLADWSALKPFDAACQAMTYVLRRDATGPEVVPVRRYQAGPGAPRGRSPVSSWASVAPGLLVVEEGASQVDADGGPYMIDAPAVLPRLLALLGPSAYRGRRATETSPHGVFWLRPVEGAPAPGPGLVVVENAANPRARGRVAAMEAVVECDWLHPLLRGNGIRPFGVTLADALLLLPHDAASGAKAIAPEAAPRLTLGYLQAHRSALEARSSYKEYRSHGPFYAMWRVGPYTFAPYKVVWPEMGELRAAVISTAPTPWGEAKLLIPEGKVNLVGLADEAEAHYMCALLNAPSIRRSYRRMSSQIGRPSRLPFALPAFDGDRPSHRALAAVSRAAHARELAPERLDAVLEWLLSRVMPYRPG